jgi:hypothetical protein
MTFAAASLAEYLEMQNDEVVLLCLPLSFDYGLYQLLLTVLVGGTLVLEKGFAFPGRVVGLLESEGVTGLPGVPTLFGVLLGLRGLGDRELPALRYLSNTGAALSVTTIAGLRETFPAARIYSMYGLTECKRCTYLPPEQLARRPGSVGIAIPGTEAYVVDESGRRAAPGEVGELVIRGAHVMKGYWADPEATDRALRSGPHPWEKVLYTGDLFRADQDGYLYFVGRKDDIIKSRGEKVSPKEIENVLYELAGVREAAVVGVPDPLLGMAIKAVLALASLNEFDPSHLAFLEQLTASIGIALTPASALVPDALIDRADQALYEAKTAGRGRRYPVLYMLHGAAAALRSGDALVMFPEGTRTRPGQPLHFLRGAASVAVHAADVLTPVFIRCEPLVLPKFVPWYRVPSQRPHFTLEVGEDIDLAAYRGLPPPRASRLLNDWLLGHYTERLGNSGGYNGTPGN